MCQTVRSILELECTWSMRTAPAGRLLVFSFHDDTRRKRISYYILLHDVKNSFFVCSLDLYFLRTKQAISFLFVFICLCIAQCFYRKRERERMFATTKRYLLTGRRFLSTTPLSTLWNPTSEHAALRETLRSFVHQEVMQTVSDLVCYLFLCF